MPIGPFAFYSLQIAGFGFNLMLGLKSPVRPPKLVSTLSHS